MVVHDLKIRPEYFKAVADGRKKFELRKNDRGFSVGDHIYLYEYGAGGLTGRYCLVEVTYILENAKKYGLLPGYAVLSFNLLETV